MKTTIIARLIFLLIASTFSSALFAENLTIACGAVGQERQYCIESVERWSALTGHTVRVINTPNSSSERLAMYQILLRERHDTVDVFQIDVVWPGLLHRYLLDLSEYIPLADINAHFPALIENNTVGEKLVGMPWYVDTGLLYYRKDLLDSLAIDVPTTWEELKQAAQTVLQERATVEPNLTGYVFQADTYEGLTCNFVEWLGSAEQKNIISTDNRINLSDPKSATVLNLVKDLVNSDLTPDEILTFREEDARTVFQEGNAVFMRNWPYAWNLAQQPDSPIAGKVGVTLLPGYGSESSGSGTLGGWQLAVTKYTRHPELAADLVNFMTSTAEQRTRLALGYFPTRNELYQQIPSADIQPLFDAVGTSLERAAARPATVLGRNYKDVSRVLYNEVHNFLSTDSITAEQLFDTLESEVSRVTLDLIEAQ